MEKEEKEDANGTENSGTLAASNSSSSVSPGNFNSMLERVNFKVINQKIWMRTSLNDFCIDLILQIIKRIS